MRGYPHFCPSYEIHSEHAEKKALFCCAILVQIGPMIYGYARVSTDGQSVDAQVRQLKAAGAESSIV